MRRFILSAAAAALVLAAAALPARGGDNPNYAPEFAIALKGGVWNTDTHGLDAAGAYGIELSANDPMIDPLIGKVRHMLSFNHADHDGLELSTVEWNTHWMIPAGPGLWLGAGPGIGYVWADGHAIDNSAAIQFGASAIKVVGHAQFGIESRYQWTEGDSTNNWLTMLKVGYQF